MSEAEMGPWPRVGRVEKPSRGDPNSRWVPSLGGGAPGLSNMYGISINPSELSLASSLGVERRSLVS